MTIPWSLWNTWFQSSQHCGCWWRYAHFLVHIRNTPTWCSIARRVPGHIPNRILVDFFNRQSHPILAWWRHQMEAFSALLAICARIHRSPVNSPHKGQWRGALMFPLICVWINGWVKNRQAGDLRRYRAHYDVTVMWIFSIFCGIDSSRFSRVRNIPQVQTVSLLRCISCYIEKPYKENWLFMLLYFRSFANIFNKEHILLAFFMQLRKGCIFLCLFCMDW